MVEFMWNQRLNVEKIQGGALSSHIRVGLTCGSAMGHTPYVRAQSTAPKLYEYYPKYGMVVMACLCL